MHQRKLVVMENDDEKRTMSWGEAEDSLAYVRETTMGTVTEFAYGERFWETTFFFRPTNTYNLDDVADRVAKSGSDCFLCDIAEPSSSGASRMREKTAPARKLSSHG